MNLLSNSLAFVIVSLLLPGFLLSGNSCRLNDGKKPLNEPRKKTFSVVFYNTENFYDTINDPKTNDDEFTPQGRIPWTSERFLKKEQNLAEVFSKIVSPGMPDIIGMAEVENRYVLEKLIAQPGMAAGNYGIVHYDSPDERGIDVAMLYNRKTFTVQGSEPIAVILDGGADKTRDILHVTGKTAGGITLHIFVNHWPSRREGSDISESKRMSAALVLHEQVEKVLKNDTAANIIILGDFNDNPDNRSITEGLGALPPDAPLHTGKLYDLLLPRFKNGSGSLYYKSWDLFDQIIVSGNMLNKGKALHCSAPDADIFRAPWLLFTNNKGVDVPNRTMGSKYYGGYSDHLPVFVTFR